MVNYYVPLSWYEGAYKDDREPCKAARPFSLTNEESKSAALLIHGYTGYPGELVRPARDMYSRGIDVYVPRLPGHGTDGRNFSSSRYFDWVKTAEAALKDLKERYEKVYLLGHSMGAAISLIIAKDNPVDRLALISGAIPAPGDKAPVPLFLIRALSLVLRKKKIEWKSDSEYVMYYEDAPADDEYLGSEYWSYLYIKQTADLLLLMQRAREAAKDVKADTLLLVGSKDSIINPKGSEWAKETIKGSNKFQMIDNGTHFLFYDKDKRAEEEAVSLVLSWFGL